MVEYTLAHIGINAENAEESLEAVKLFEAMFGFKVKEGNSSNFAGTVIEVNKKPGRGAHGHIAIGTPDVAAACEDLESRGFAIDPESKKYKPDGTMNAAYLQTEVLGFAIHLLKI